MSPADRARAASAVRASVERDTGRTTGGRIPSWSEVRLAHRRTAERLTVLVISDDGLTIYGNPINPSDGRVAFPSRDWRWVA